MQTDDFVLVGYGSSSELQVCCSKLRNKACRHSQNAAGDKREKRPCEADISRNAIAH